MTSNELGFPRGRAHHGWRGLGTGRLRPVSGAKGSPATPKRQTRRPSERPDSWCRRLTPAAVAGVRGIAGAWKLTRIQTARLLGVAPRTWSQLLAGSSRQVLSQRQMTRASALMGIYKGLNTLFADGMADRWPNLPSSAPVFGGRSPIDAMIEGGLPMMLDVRRYVDALCG